MIDIYEQEQIIWEKELDDYVRQVYFINDGLQVLAITSGGKAYAFTKGGNERIFSRQLHDAAIISSAISKQHNILATGGEDGKFLMSNIETGEIIYTFCQAGKWIEHVAFSPNGNYVAFACERKVYIITEKGELYDTIIKPNNTVSALAWHHDAETLAVGSFGGVDLYNLSTMELYQHLPWKNAVVSLTISPCKKYVCSGTQDYQVHIWPLPYKEESDLAMSGFPNKVKYLHWHYEGKLLATNSGKEVIIWDFSDKGPASKPPDILKGHFLNVTAIAFQHTNDTVVSGDEGGLLFFFNPKINNRTDNVVNVQAEISALCWSADDTYLIVGTATGGLFMIENPVEEI